MSIFFKVFCLVKCFIIVGQNELNLAGYVIATLCVEEGVVAPRGFCCRFFTWKLDRREMLTFDYFTTMQQGMAALLLF